MTRRAAVLAAPLAAAALAGCGSSHKVDPDDLENQIAGFIDRTTGVKITVDCPGGIEAEKGRRFTCTSESVGQERKFVIEFVSDDGKFRIAQTSATAPTTTLAP